MDLDQGGRQRAGLILDAAGRGEHDRVADLIAPPDAEQLRSLVTVLAVQVDQSVPASSATGPATVCELAIKAAAPMFGTTPEAIRSAEHFNKDHGSVIHAVRCTAERPRLADAAARVSEHVNSRYTARLPRSEENVVTSTSSPRPQPSGPRARSSTPWWRPQRPSTPHPRSSWVPTGAGWPRTPERWP
ncbi:hypothetical protein [Nocardioides daeguensis]|uniref:DUF222 domain-containing protein n=1 Tax=Nocardioides daeguensis TaxID=908359 RepID=A0ABP6UVD2_9ACTN|nr:hypothetical protein [Nocardioides daeguensis]MBV6728156.1 hypothetical protein [Nocardioides daeguensis]MCR1772966.1 hypothetical protein [Nocardioides daeguensis]